MREVKYLGCISLDPIVDDTDSGDHLQDWEQEISQESNIVLNGIPFSGSHHFLSTVKELCYKFSESTSGETSAFFLYKSLLMRMARSTSASDAHFRLNAIMGSPDLMLLPTTRSGSSGGAPVRANVYVSGGMVHATITTTHSYGLYRKSDVRPSEIRIGRGGTMQHASRPWIALQACVDERVNFTTRDSVRHVRVRLPETLY